MFPVLLAQAIVDLTVAAQLIERLPIGGYSDLGVNFFYNVTKEERDQWVGNDGLAHALFSDLARLPAERTLHYPVPEDFTPKPYPRTGNL